MSGKTRSFLRLPWAIQAERPDKHLGESGMERKQVVVGTEATLEDTGFDEVNIICAMHVLNLFKRDVAALLENIEGNTSFGGCISDL